MKALYELKEMLCKELEEIAKKGELTAGSLETAHKLTDTIKNIGKIMDAEYISLLNITCKSEKDDRMTSDKSIRKTLWVRCPHCDGKTRIKVYEDTVMLNFPLFCRKCQRETVVNIVKLKMVISDEPDA